MRVAVKMPAFSSGMETGVIVRWLKSTGDAVRRGEPIAEIETDKATVEMEAMVSGVLVEILEPSGQEVPVGVAIASIEAAS